MDLVGLPDECQSCFLKKAKVLTQIMNIGCVHILLFSKIRGGAKQVFNQDGVLVDVKRFIQRMAMFFLRAIMYWPRKIMNSEMLVLPKYFDPRQPLVGGECCR